MYKNEKKIDWSDEQWNRIDFESYSLFFLFSSSNFNFAIKKIFFILWENLIFETFNFGKDRI